MAQNKNSPEASHAAVITQGEAHHENAAAAAQEIEIVQGVVNAQNNAAAIAALRPIQRFLHNIFGLTRTQCVAVTSDGYEYFMDFENIQWESIEK